MPSEGNASKHHRDESDSTVKVVTVPIEEYLGWLTTLSNIPTQYGALVYIAMSQRLSATVSALARESAMTADASHR
jgi:hypothetical protein